MRADFASPGPARKFHLPGASGFSFGTPQTPTPPPAAAGGGFNISAPSPPSVEVTDAVAIGPVGAQLTRADEAGLSEGTALVFRITSSYFYDGACTNPSPVTFLQTNGCTPPAQVRWPSGHTYWVNWEDLCWPGSSGGGSGDGGYGGSLSSTAGGFEAAAGFGGTGSPFAAAGGGFTLSAPSPPSAAVERGEGGAAAGGVASWGGGLVAGGDAEVFPGALFEVTAAGASFGVADTRARAVEV